jgi:hypothetical protein
MKTDLVSINKNHTIPYIPIHIDVNVGKKMLSGPLLPWHGMYSGYGKG